MVKKDYATALVELRSKLDISQHEMAELLNVSYPSVNRWENNTSYSNRKLFFLQLGLSEDNSFP